MMKLLKWSAMGVGLLVLAVALFLLYMRFNDGPIAVFSGGAFQSGELAATPPDWNSIRDYDTIEFQTLAPSTSRTVWLAVHQGRLFLVSGYMNTSYGGIWKQWPHYIEEEDRIILRIDGMLYEQRLQRIMDGPDVVPVLNELGRKYFPANAPPVQTIAPVTSGDIWMYEVLPR